MKDGARPSGRVTDGCSGSDDGTPLLLNSPLWRVARAPRAHPLAEPEAEQDERRIWSESAFGSDTVARSASLEGVGSAPDDDDCGGTT